MKHTLKPWIFRLILLKGKCIVEIIKDIVNQEQIDVNTKVINTSNPLHIELLSVGGYLMKINGVTMLENLNNKILLTLTIGHWADSAKLKNEYI